MACYHHSTKNRGGSAFPPHHHQKTMNQMSTEKPPHPKAETLLVMSSWLQGKPVQPPGSVRIVVSSSSAREGKRGTLTLVPSRRGPPRGLSGRTSPNPRPPGRRAPEEEGREGLGPLRGQGHHPNGRSGRSSLRKRRLHPSSWWLHGNNTMTKTTQSISSRLAPTRGVAWPTRAPGSYRG